MNALAAFDQTYHAFLGDVGWEPKDHPRGGDPENPGRFSETVGTGKKEPEAHARPAEPEARQPELVRTDLAAISEPYARRDIPSGAVSRIRSDTASVKSVYEPAAQLREAFARIGADPATYHEFQPGSGQDFAALIEASKRGNPFAAAVDVHPAEEYDGMRCFSTPDGMAGFALHDDEIISVYKLPGGPKNAVASALALAVEEGGRRLDCFDTVLPQLYSCAGFKAIARIPFNEEYKPEGWDYQRFGKFNNGRPDVVGMVYDPDYAPNYMPNDGVRVAEYDDIASKQRQALGLDDEIPSLAHWYPEPSEKLTGKPDNPYSHGMLNSAATAHWYPTRSDVGTSEGTFGNNAHWYPIKAKPSAEEVAARSHRYLFGDAEDPYTFASAADDFDPSQPRDKGGKWTETGASAGAVEEKSPVKRKLKEVTVFHSTKEEFLKSIKEKGLLIHPPQRAFPSGIAEGFYEGERGESIYATDNLQDALAWAKAVARGGEDVDPVDTAILEIRVPRSKLKRDEHGQLTGTAALRYGADIPPDWITTVRHIAWKEGRASLGEPEAFDQVSLDESNSVVFLVVALSDKKDDESRFNWEPDDIEWIEDDTAGDKKFDPQKHPRGGNPKNPGQFSETGGAGKKAYTEFTETSAGTGYVKSLKDNFGFHQIDETPDSILLAHQPSNTMVRIQATGEWSAVVEGTVKKGSDFTSLERAIGKTGVKEKIPKKFDGRFGIVPAQFNMKGRGVGAQLDETQDERYKSITPFVKLGWAGGAGWRDDDAPGVTEEERRIREAVDTWVGEGYRGIKRDLREGKIPAAGQQLVDDIDTACQSFELPRDTEVVRSLTLSRVLKEGEKPEDLVGRSFVDNSYVSVSMRTYVSAEFIRTKQGSADEPLAAMMSIKLPKGTKCAHIGVVVDEWSEAELLLPRGGTFKVIDGDEFEYSSSGFMTTTHPVFRVEYIPKAEATDTAITALDQQIFQWALDSWTEERPIRWAIDWSLEEANVGRSGESGEFVTKGAGTAGAAGARGPEGLKGAAGKIIQPSKKLIAAAPTWFKGESIGEHIATGVLARSPVLLTPMKARIFKGTQVLASKMEKHAAGKLGEHIALTWVQDILDLKDAAPANLMRSNFPIDIVGGNFVFEVKTGQISNVRDAQQWRATIGEAGDEEKEYLKTLSGKAKAEYNEVLMVKIMERKEWARAQYEKLKGRKIEPKTITLIINPDTGMADLFEFDGFHKRIGWRDEYVQNAYRGTFNYEQAKRTARGSAGDRSTNRGVFTRLAEGARPALW